jgi:TatA/E family protein of Tat protein translocase
MPTPGPLELVIILVIALLVLGPGKLPEVGASLGKSIREFRKASSDVQESVKVDVDTSPQAPAAAAPLAPTPAAPLPAPIQAPAPVADAASPDPSDPTETASAGATNAADSPITAG